MSLYTWNPDDKNRCSQIDAMVQRAVKGALEEDNPHPQQRHLDDAKLILWNYLKFNAEEMKLKYPQLETSLELVERPLYFADKFTPMKRRFSNDWSFKDLSLSDVGSFAIFSFLQNHICLNTPEEADEWRTPLLCRYSESESCGSFLEFLEESLKSRKTQKIDEILILEPEVTILVKEIICSADEKVDFRSDRQRAIALMLAPFVYKAYARYVSSTPELHQRILRDRTERINSQLAIVNCWLERYILLSRDEYNNLLSDGKPKRTLAVHAYSFDAKPKNYVGQRGFAAMSIKSLFTYTRSTRDAHGGGGSDKINTIFVKLEENIANELGSGFDEGSTMWKRADNKRSDSQLKEVIQESVAPTLSDFLNSVPPRRIESQADIEGVLLFHLWALHINPLYLSACYEEMDVRKGQFTLMVEKVCPDLFEKKSNSKLRRTSFYDLIRDEYAHRKMIIEIASSIEAQYKAIGYDISLVATLKNSDSASSLLLSWMESDYIRGRHFSTFIRDELKRIMGDSSFREMLSKSLEDAQTVLAPWIDTFGEED